MINNVTLVGRLTRDVELRYLQGKGTAVASFTVAVDRDYKDKDGNTPTDFLPIEVMGKPAEFAANYLGKGRLVGVIGSVRVDKYKDKDGNNKSYTKIAARQVQALDKLQNTKAGDYDAAAVMAGATFDTTTDEDVPF